MSVHLQHPQPLPTDTPHAPDPAHPFIPPAYQQLMRDRPSTRRPMRKNPRVIQLIGTLGAGGAERQLVNLALGLATRHVDVTVLTSDLLQGAHAFHLPTLVRNQIPARSLPRTTTFPHLERLPHAPDLIAQLPNWLRPGCLQMMEEFLRDPPDVLHSWLDFTNISGAIAALIAGVPKIILSTRNVNPSHFPYLNIRWFQPWYRFFAEIQDLVFINNSVAGQNDYAAWMEVKPSRFQVIRNGIDTAHYQRAAPAEIAAVRDELQLAPTDQLITGAFRLSPEKRPELFLQVVESLMHSRPTLHAAIFGRGPLEPEIQDWIAQSPFRSRIRLLPPRSSLAPIYSASEAVLQTSLLEGTPNTLLEAQAVGCPVVTTLGGGAEEALLPGRTGYVGTTAQELAAQLAHLLDNPSLRASLSSQSRPFIESRYSLSRMIEQTLDLYTSGK